MKAGAHNFLEIKFLCASNSMSLSILANNVRVQAYG